jgi:hypothetical protein
VNRWSFLVTVTVLLRTVLDEVWSATTKALAMILITTGWTGVSSVIGGGSIVALRQLRSQCWPIMIRDQTAIELMYGADQSNGAELGVFGVFDDGTRIKDLVFVFHSLDVVQKIEYLSIEFFGACLGYLLEKT